jgi:hypothetical protein
MVLYVDFVISYNKEYIRNISLHLKVWTVQNYNSRCVIVFVSSGYVGGATGLQMYPPSQPMRRRRSMRSMRNSMRNMRRRQTQSMLTDTKLKRKLLL